MKKQKRKNLKLDMSNLYVVLALFFVLGFGFFGTSKIFMAEEIPINQTELNTEFDLRSNGKFSINSWIYDEEKNKMEVIIVTNGMRDYSSELDFTSISRKNLKQELPVDVVFNDNEIYILHINKVPKNFDQLAIRLHKTEWNMKDIFAEPESVKENEKLVSTIYTDERVVERKPVDKKDNKEYTVQVTNDIIKQTKEKKDEMNKKIERANEVNEGLNEEISNLKSDLLYQTMEEQIETNNKIYQLEREVESNKKEIEIMQQDIKNMDLKIEKLNQKIRDIEI